MSRHARIFFTLLVMCFMFINGSVTLALEDTIPDIQIGDQTILPGESFRPIVLADMLQEAGYPADQLTWTISNNRYLAVEIADGVATITPTDPAWRGSETLHFEACDAAATCRIDQATFWVMEDANVPVTVTYVGNSGFMITAGDQKILIDAMFEGLGSGYTLPAEEVDLLVNAQPPFDGIDLILATHDHGDHFSAAMVCQHMKNNPGAKFVSTVDAAHAVMAEGCPAMAINLTQGQSMERIVNGIDVEAMFLSHGDPDYENLGYLITAGGQRFFHTGDIDSHYVTADYLASLGVPEKNIDVAFIPHFYMRTKNSPQVSGVSARYNIPIHYYFTTPPLSTTLVLRYYPDAIFFDKEMDTWTMP